MWNRSIRADGRRPIAGGRADAAGARRELEAAGYSRISDIKSTAEGTAVKAMKDGKEVRLVVDSSGQIKEQR
jgi:hypothetical protein